ncbi:hypothetical protein ACX80N_12345 [Arthrobacter sp. MDT2-16]
MGSSFFEVDHLPLPDAPLRTVTTVQRETLASLSLYISHHTWAQLTTEEKECLADAIDAEPGEDPDLPKVERWWRD